MEQVVGNGKMPVESEVERLNDKLAREHSINDYYDRSPFLVRWIEQQRLRIIREMVAYDPNHQILEIGSGGGHVLRMFKRAKLTAVDVSDVFLAAAAANLAGYDVEFIKGEIDKLGLPAKKFDRIICTEVLEHTKDPEAILQEIARLLRPGGRAVITVPNDPLINRLKTVVKRTPVGWVLRGRIDWGGDIYHIHVWRPAEFRAILERHFEVEEQRCAPSDLLPLRPCFLCRAKR
ncbi:MAG TPA: methyltransferase domain-containing protein [Polyangiaceae bacterium]|nr:methyltransferase domain-containing protein [Polyangiaceae bacterium]